MINSYSTTSSCFYYVDYSFLLQLMKINFDSIAIDSVERFGLIIRSALLNARSLAADLAGAVNKVRANGRKALNLFSLKTLLP